MAADLPNPEGGLVWSIDVEEARWWSERLEPWLDPGIRSIVPDGFEAVTRIFHPVEDVDGRTGSWSALAAANGREAHPWMQLHAIATPAGQPVDPRADGPVDPYVSEGHLPDPPRTTLVALLAEATATPERCWFGVWDGFGQLHGSPAVSRLTHYRSGRWRWNREPIPGLAPPEILSGQRAEAPGRGYLLLRGPLGAVDAITDGLGRQCPNLWWPQDRSWFLVTEIDFAWTYVAGSDALATAIEQADGIEAMRSDLDRPATVDSDDRNR